MDGTMGNSIPQHERNDHLKASINTLWSQSATEVGLWCTPPPMEIDAVLFYVMNDGSERPIAFASRTLTRTEQGYAQTDKEALAIIWGVKKFHVYLFGQSFTLYTDHQPLTYIFHPHKSIPVVTAAGLQCYALFLAGYDHKIEYKNTKVRSNADGLSRPPL